MQRSCLVAVGVVLLCLAAIVAWGRYRAYRAEIPSPVLRYFADLPEIEFCTVNPTEVDAIDSGEMEKENENDYIEAFRVIDRRVTPDSQYLTGLVRYADRHNNSVSAACFWPRHAIRDPDDHENYILICFSCQNLYWQLNGDRGFARVHEPAAFYFNKYADGLMMRRERFLGSPMGEQYIR